MRLSLLCEFPSGAAGFRQVDTSVFGVHGWFKKSSLGSRRLRCLSVSEVSQTGDRCRYEEFQPLAITVRVEGFVDWEKMSQVSWTSVQPVWVLKTAGDFCGGVCSNRSLAAPDVGGFVNSVQSSSNQFPRNLWLGPRHLQQQHCRQTEAAFLHKEVS
jgi:hypothetical protein